MNEMESIISELLHKTQDAGVKLVAVTKTVPVERINEAISYGIRAIGENKVQELLEKYDRLDKEKVEIHLIGTLQSNKVKYIIDKVDMIHSVDSLKLAQTIDRLAKSIGKVQNILVQVNISNEQSKGGVNPDNVMEFVTSLSQFDNIRVRGLMCIPSLETFPGQNAPFFTSIYKMMVDINAKNIDNIHMDTLSMGMSADYETAIACGATIVRIGTKIFGKRNYTEV